MHSREVLELAVKGIAEHVDVGEPRYFVLAMHDCAVAGLRNRELLAALSQRYF